MDEIHLNEVAKIGYNLLTADHKLTFSTISRENKKVDYESKYLLLLELDNYAGVIQW